MFIIAARCKHEDSLFISVCYVVSSLKSRLQHNSISVCDHFDKSRIGLLCVVLSKITSCFSVLHIIMITSIEIHTFLVLSQHVLKINTINKSGY